MNKRLKKKLFDAAFGTTRAISYAIRNSFPQKMPQPDTNAIIDVAIPVVPKDLPTLPICVAAVRKFIPHKILKIYIIAPDNQKIRHVAKSLNADFIDENTILPGSPDDIRIDRKDRENRKGWIFQQFIKLSANVGTAKDILFIDADHILLRPHTFIAADGSRIFYASKEAYFPYYDNIRRLTGKFPLHTFSFIAHKMMFNRQQLRELQATLLYSPFAQKINSLLPPRNAVSDWKEIILRSLDWDYPSPFSEFELYPHLIHPSRRKTMLWKQIHLKSLPDQFYSSDDDCCDCKKIESIINHLQLKFPDALSVTFPAYLR